uniref:Uncharacterized protein n=2 Tax=Hyaloperonospora arabidopsidis (strain Emoy2) TaxID=559515 RepID=M4BHU6_HYAAE
MSDDCSDSLSDLNCCSPKRKQNSQDGSDISTSDGGVLNKCNRRSVRSEGMDDHCSQSVGEDSIGLLLRMDANDEPVHPQVVLCEQQAQVKRYMQRYIREYVDYMTAHPELANHACNTIGTEARGDVLHASASKPTKVTPVSSKDGSSIPISLPLLAGNVQDSLLIESPQSVVNLDSAQVASPQHLKRLRMSSIADFEPDVETSLKLLICCADKGQARAPSNRPPVAESTSSRSAVAAPIDAGQKLLKAPQPLSHL